MTGTITFPATPATSRTGVEGSAIICAPVALTVTPSIVPSGAGGLGVGTASVSIQSAPDGTGSVGVPGCSNTSTAPGGPCGPVGPAGPCGPPGAASARGTPVAVAGASGTRVAVAGASGTLGPLLTCVSASTGPTARARWRPPAYDSSPSAPSSSRSEAGRA